MAAAVRRRVSRRPTTWTDELATLLPIVLVLVGGSWYATLHQAAAGDLARATGVVLLTQTLPGLVIWRSVRPVSGWLVEDLAVGTAIGAALAVPGQVLGVHLDRPGFQWGLGLAVAFLAYFLPWSRRRILRAEWYRLPLSWGWAVAVAAAGSLALSTRPFSQVLPGHATWATQYPDVPYHVALSAELEHRFPPHSPHVASEVLDYHWFSHAWLGNLAALTGVPNDVLVTRWAPVFLGVVIVLALACLGTRLGGPAAGAVLALASVVVRQIPLQSSWSLFSLFTPISPSTGFGLLVGIGLVTVLVARWRGESPWWGVPLLALLCVTVGGAKGSWLPILAVGCVLAALVALVGRSRFTLRVLLDTGVVIGSLVLALRVLFRGNDGGTAVVPFHSLADSTAHAVTGVPTDGPWPMPDVLGLTVVLALMALLPLTGVLGLVVRGRWRDPAGWLFIGSFLAGLGAMMVFTHPGNSQHYFFQAGLPLGLAAAAWGLALLVDDGAGPRWRGWLVALLAGVVGWLLISPLRDAVPGAGSGILAGFVTFAFLLYAFTVLGHLLRGLHRHAVILAVAAGLAGSATVGMFRSIDEHPFQQPPTEVVEAVDRRGAVVVRPLNGAISAGEWQAMSWIARNTDPDDLVMTNRHCFSPRGECNNRRFWLAAYGERRVLVEGWGYTRRTSELHEAGTMALAADEEQPRSALLPFWDLGLLALNDALYSLPNEPIADALYDRGVRWVYAERRIGFSDRLAEVADEVFANDDAAVYRLRGEEGE